MKKKLHIVKTPLWLLLSGIIASFLIILTVFGGIYLGTKTKERFHDIQQSWHIYSNEAELRGELLNRMWANLGYGGLIHNFKNYILRQDEIYLDKFEEQFKDFNKTIKDYRQSNPTEEELKNLKIIEDTILLYFAKIPIAKQAALENWSPIKTDKLVKVDDASALIALGNLDSLWREKRYETTKIIAKAVVDGDSLITLGFRFMAGLVVVSLSLFTLFYLLQMELRQTISLLSRELSERKLAQLEAKKFQRVVEQSPVTIIITDIKRKIEYVNKKFCELTGYNFDEVVGKTPSFLQFGEIENKNYQSLNKQLEQGEEWQGTFHNKKKNGEFYWAKTSILPLRDENETISHYIGLGEDITNQKQASEQMLRAQKMEAVGMLASGVAHDFNNILTIILGNVFLARQDVKEKTDLAYELEQIEIAAKRARNMVGQILAFARKQPGENVPIRVGSAIEEVVKLMRSSILPNIKIDCKIEDKNLSVIADPTRLHQVIMNLCSNAAEAIGVNDGTITITAHAQKNNDSQICICVTDNGPGISKDIQEKIFDPFFTTKQMGKGTGLGLSVVVSLVDQMSGTITLKSSSPKGSEFNILLPKANSVKLKTKQTELLATGFGKILLIDDQKEVLDICNRILNKMNYNVDVFTNPKDAMNIFSKNPNDYVLVMTDYVMPEMNGTQVCEKLRKLNKEIPIIIYSAYSPDLAELEKFKEIKILEKPIDPLLLSQILNEILG